MTDPNTLLANLRRPRLLIDAAHLGIADYRREQTLGRLLPEGPDIEHGGMFQSLAAREATMNAERRAGGATYSVARHIELLVAMIVEARRLTDRPV